MGSLPAELLLEPGQWAVGSQARQPLGFVDLDAWPAGAPLGPSPPFPLIGLGARDHPLAGSLDAILEPPVSADVLIRSVGRAPHAAAVLVQLLRSIEGLSPDRALPLESIGYGLLQGSREHAAWLASRPSELSPPPGRVLAVREGSVLYVTLDRPAARNAIDRAMRDQLHEAFTVASLDPDLHRVVLRAVGHAFSIGGDLAEFGTTRDLAEAHWIRSQALPALPFAACAAKAEVHVQGACIGAGIELAAFAGRVTAAPGAWFQLPELSMGLIPGAGGCVSIPRRIGRQRTVLMILSGRRISAATALAWGLIDAIVDDPAADQRGADEVRR